MSFASQFQFAVRKLSFVCHDCKVWTIVLGGAARQKTRHKQDKKKDLPSIHVLLVPTVIHANSSVYLGNSHPRMLPATIQTWTYTGRLQLKHRRSQRKQTFCNLLRTRKYFTTGHMHIYSIPPMSRMNFKQKIVPKLLCSDFIQVFSLTVATTFFGNHNQLSNFLNSNTILNYQIEERSM